MNQIQEIGEVEASPIPRVISDEELAIHLQNCLRANDPGLLHSVLSHLARCKDLTQPASPPSNRRANLLRRLSMSTEPSFADVLAMTCAIGFRMHFEAMSTLRDRASDHR